MTIKSIYLDIQDRIQDHFTYNSLYIFPRVRICSGTIFIFRDKKTFVSTFHGLGINESLAYYISRRQFSSFEMWFNFKKPWNESSAMCNRSAINEDYFYRTGDTVVPNHKNGAQWEDLVQFENHRPIPSRINLYDKILFVECIFLRCCLSRAIYLLCKLFPHE